MVYKVDYTLLRFDFVLSPIGKPSGSHSNLFTRHPVVLYSFRLDVLFLPEKSPP